MRRKSINTHFTRVPKSFTFTNQSIEKAINLSSTNKLNASLLFKLIALVQLKIDLKKQQNTSQSILQLTAQHRLQIPGFILFKQKTNRCNKCAKQNDQ